MLGARNMRATQSWKTLPVSLVGCWGCVEDSKLATRPMSEAYSKTSWWVRVVKTTSSGYLGVKAHPNPVRTDRVAGLALHAHVGRPTFSNIAMTERGSPCRLVFHFRQHAHLNVP